MTVSPTAYELSTTSRGVIAGGPAKRCRTVGIFPRICLQSRTSCSRAVGGPMVYSPAPDLQKHGARWLSSIMQYRDVEVVAPSATLRNALLATGIVPIKCHLIRPGVDFGRIKRRNPQIRESLGLGKDDVVLLGSGESTR